jgi:DcuC family C4-dicarboxylate transporter
MLSATTLPSPLPPSPARSAITLAVILLGGVALLRRADVRLTLAVCSAILFLIANRFLELFITIASEMVNQKTVVPICSAMGFAYVCKLTECDRHLVELMVRPMRRFAWLLIPGGVAVGFIVNAAIVSQTSTVAVVGPVIVPLVLAAGISRRTAGAMLLLGGSMGGELFNPGCVELIRLGELTGVSPTLLVRRIAGPNLLAAGAALTAFWILERWSARSEAPEIEPKGLSAASPQIFSGYAAGPEATPQPQLVFEPHPIKALIPLLPIVLLLCIPERFMPANLPVEVRIGVAMLIGCVAAALAAPRQANRIATTFCEGAGFAYANVISLIVLATTFARSIVVNGLVGQLAQTLGHNPAAVTFASIALPLGLAALTGTAVGTAPTAMAIIVPLAQRVGLEPIYTGTLNAIAAAFGRTSSPIAPVVLMCATLTRTNPLSLVRRVIPPLLIAAAILLLVSLARKP